MIPGGRDLDPSGKRWRAWIDIPRHWGAGASCKSRRPRNDHTSAFPVDGIGPRFKSANARKWKFCTIAVRRHLTKPVARAISFRSSY